MEDQDEAVQPLLSKNEKPNYSRGEEAAEDPAAEPKEGFASRCLDRMGCSGPGATAAYLCVALSVSYEAANGTRTCVTDRSAKRSVKLFEKDEDAFHRHQPMEFKVPRDDDIESIKKSADPNTDGFPDDVECTVCLEFARDDGLQMEADPVDVSDAIRDSHGHLVVFLHDENGNYRGRVHMTAKYHQDTEILSLCIKHISQLHLPDSTDSSESMVAGRQRMVLLALFVHVFGGLAFFMLYVKASLVDSLLFIASLIVVTGVTDIMDTHDPRRPDGSLVYDKELVRWFLIFYMIFGVVILFTFVSAYFTYVMHHLNQKLTSMGVCGYGSGESACRNYTGGYITGKLGSYIVGALIIFLSNSIALTCLEGWTFLDSSYFTVSTMISVGFVDDLKVTTSTGKIWLACWMPLANLTFFYLLSEYLVEAAKDKQEVKRMAMLQGALQQPEDLIALADFAGDGTVSKFEYVKFILLHVGDIEHDDMLAIEERFDQLDKDGNGRIEAWELSKKGRTDKGEVDDEDEDEEDASPRSKAERASIAWATQKAKVKHHIRHSPANTPRTHYDGSEASAQSPTPQATPQPTPAE